jgi:hypothetical protein
MMGKIRRLLYLWGQCFRSMKNGNTYVPFLIYAVVQVLLLYGLNNFARSPFAVVLVPLVRRFFGEAALHYPNFYMILASLYSQMNIVLSGLVGIVMVGTATYIFAGGFNNRPVSFGQALGAVMKKYGVLFIIWLIVSAMIFAVILGFPYLVTQLLQPSYMLGRVVEMIGLLLGILTASIFSYTSALIILDNQKLLKTISTTLAMFKRNAGTTFLLVAIPTLFYFPISYLSRRIDLIVSKFSPEMIVVVLGIGILITFISGYVQTSTITRFYLLLKEKR